MAAVRWTGFLGSSLGKLCVFVSVLFAILVGAVSSVPLDLSPVTGSALARQEGQRPVAGGFELPVGHGEFGAVVSIEVVGGEVASRRDQNRMCEAKSARATDLPSSAFPTLAVTAPRSGPLMLEVPSKSLYLVPALHSVSLHRRPRPSLRRRIASAHICTAVPRTRPLLPPFSSTPTNTAATTSSSITCSPASTSAAPSHPRRHTTRQSLLRLSIQLAPRTVLGPDRLRPSPIALVLESW
jgi:hypothetical protein